MIYWRRRVAARIAVIDDDADFRQFMSDALGDCGWEVMPCAEALAAYDLLRAATPDLIVLDLRIDGHFAGWDILTFLQLHPTLHRVPVILCTAAVDEAQRRADWLRDHGVTVLTKPFDLDDLYGLINHHLPSKLPAVTTA